jgi:hypothetical protein
MLMVVTSCSIVVATDGRSTVGSLGVFAMSPMAAVPK